MFIVIGMFGLSCALSCAGGSLCTDYFKNKTLPELKLITPGNIYELFNISINPNRANCVLLAYKALQLFLKDNMIH
jgi:NifU-like protein involved in Fe-S cluster formation